ncbi:MAG: aminotransferase [Candidatus Competibacteraceae bacterium]|nr:aminotransferase [Candidatus Competibacteraceae bacterium]
MKNANAILSSYGTTVFEIMSRLAIEHQSINLGQGFPDEDGPDSLKRKAYEAMLEFPNQYPPMLGVPELRQAVAAHNQRYYGIDSDWQREVMVTSGATEALAASILALIEPGDEVILFEPLYDSYLPMVRRAGGIPKLIRLQPPHWELPQEQLAAAFSERTKLILLNNPMNPSGKVFNQQELAFIAGLVERYDAYAICDEVYEHLIFDQRRHIPLLTLPGMRERAIKIGSAGKTFSMTSWKVGYLTAAPALLQVIAKAHQFLVFTTPSNLQRAVAYGLEHEQAWYTALAPQLQRKRDELAAGLQALGFGVLDCHSTYFLNADIRPLGFDDSDVEFCKRLTIEAGVTLVPVSALYTDDAAGGDDNTAAAVQHLVRFCFCKQDAVLQGALERLGAYLGAQT